MSGQSLRAEVFRLRRGRPGWAVPVLLFLAVLLVAALAFNLANLDTGGDTIPGGSTGGTEPTSVGRFDPLLGDLVIAVLAGVFVSGLIYVLMHRRARAKQPAKVFSWWEILSSTLGLALTIIVLFAWPRVLQVLRPGQGGTTGGDTGGGNLTAWPASASAPLSLFLALTVLGAILVSVSLLRRGVRGAGLEVEEPEGDPNARGAAADAVQTAIDELEIGGDVRSVILACYQRFAWLLGARGITAQDALTPRELEGLAVERLAVSPASAGTLTSLFEEARYSEHPLGDADRARAIESLATIRTALGA